MHTNWFHHPQFCPRVMLRNVTGEVLDLLFLCGRVMARRGRYIPWQHGFKSSAYYTALHRLRRKGLVVSEKRDGMLPQLRLEAPGRQQVSAALQPERFWRQPWSGRWHVLVYDIPESRHGYRRNLRIHLKRLRLGKLQGSVWVSPWDIRPDFDDLQRAAGLGAYAFLLEAHTVLGQSGRTLAAAAWNFSRLHAAQSWLLAALAEARRRLADGNWSTDQLLALLREQQSAYLAVMADDPLWPLELYPAGYLGPRLNRVHQELAHFIIRRL